jgi:hypothetical protein
MFHILRMSEDHCGSFKDFLECDILEDNATAVSLETALQLFYCIDGMTDLYVA